MKKLLLISVLILSFQPVVAANYYESISYRNSNDIFKNCCCKKSFKTSNHQYYDCELTEKPICSEGSILYSKNGIDCPGNLVFTSYK